MKTCQRLCLVALVFAVLFEFHSATVLDVSACSPACRNGGTCRDTLQAGSAPTCSCLNGYIGAGCINATCGGGVPCNGGQCSIAVIDGYQHPSCTCEQTMVGYFCQYPACDATETATLGACPANYVCGLSLFPPFDPKCICSLRPELCIEEGMCTSGSCQNGGTCSLDENKVVTCECQAPYTGKRCEISPCDTDPCLNGGGCSPNEVSNYTCTCPALTTGVNCETDMGPCGSYPCTNNQRCVNNDDFTGFTCVITCVDAPCSNGGTCIKDIAEPTCSCLPGYGEDFEKDVTNCDLIYPCLLINCQHGECRETGNKNANQFMCDCDAGWAGTLCNTPMDNCGSYSTYCNEGVCIPDASAPAPFFIRCVCPVWLTGSQCETLINYCPANPDYCNGGACVPDRSQPPNYMSCNQCPAGYTGSHCQTQINNCPSFDQYCNGGTCVPDNNRPPNFIRCINCPPGRTGMRCESTINICPALPANTCNGGTCVSSSISADMFTCVGCPAGRSGERCELNNNECTSSPCLHGGACKRLPAPDNYVCVCTPGYTGKNCEISSAGGKCDSLPCLNGGSCFEQPNRPPNYYQCVCTERYTGTNCEMSASICRQRQPCENGGTCTDVTIYPYYRCSCETPYTGEKCEQMIDLCSPQPCENGGTCIISAHGNYICICPYTHRGSRCQDPVNACSPGTCQNGGSCIMDGFKPTCQCPQGTTGLYCEITNPKYCDPNPCQNGGKCLAYSNGFLCQCNDNFEGDLCDRRMVDPCKYNHCSKDSYCIANLDKSYTCKCNSGYEGKYCLDYVGKEESNWDMNMILGVLAGSVIFLVLVIMLFWCFCIRRSGDYDEEVVYNKANDCTCDSTHCAEPVGRHMVGATYGMHWLKDKNHSTFSIN